MNRSKKIVKTSAFAILMAIGFIYWRQHRPYEFGTSIQVDTSSHPDFPTAELAALDRDVHARFATVVQRDFGIERIEIGEPDHMVYQPETAEEAKDIAALAPQKMDVLFYVMGRYGRYYKPDTAVKGPVFMTGPPNILPLDDDKSITLNQMAFMDERVVALPHEAGAIDRQDLPDLRDVQALGDPMLFPRSGLLAPRPDYSSRWAKLKYGGWKAIAVPVFSSTQKCLDCHEHFDEVTADQPLGVAMYLYRPLQTSLRTAG